MSAPRHCVGDSRVLAPQQLRPWLEWHALDDELASKRARALGALEDELAQLRSEEGRRASAEAQALAEAELAKVAAAATADRLQRDQESKALCISLAQQAAAAIRHCIGGLAPGEFEACLAEQLLAHTHGGSHAPVVMVNPDALQTAQQRVAQRLDGVVDRLRWVPEQGLAPGRVMVRLHDEILELSLDAWLDELVQQMAGEHGVVSAEGENYDTSEGVTMSQTAGDWADDGLAQEGHWQAENEGMLPTDESEAWLPSDESEAWHQPAGEEFLETEQGGLPLSAV